MTKPTFFIVILSTLILSCNWKHQSTHNVATGNNTEIKFETTEFSCDTVYPNKGYKITLTKFDTLISEYETTYNTIFTLRKNNELIFSDSIHNAYPFVKFEDFNGDNVKDILIQNTSGVRSDWSYTLYLVDTLNNTLKRIKGFEEITFPSYLAEYDLIDSYVLSGTNWTGFYKIQADTIFDFNIHIEDDLSENNSYIQEHKKAIKRILKITSK